MEVKEKLKTQEPVETTSLLVSGDGEQLVETFEIDKAVR